MTLSEFIKYRKGELGIGTRALCEKSKNLDYAQSISPSYFCQLESGSDTVDPSKVTIDRLWTLGILLKENPLHLFAISRAIEKIPTFKTGTVKTAKFSSFLKKCRETKGEGLREACSNLNKKGMFKVSAGYYSQIERNSNIKLQKVSGEKLWALGSYYNVDPLLLFVMSRNIDKKFLSAKSRNSLFPKAPKFVNTESHTQSLSFESPTTIEGLKKEVTFLTHTRNQEVVKKRKEKDKNQCQACGFKFKHKGKYLIECHHLVPIHEGVRETEIEHLVCLCPTCHKIAHLKNPPYQLSEVQNLANTYQAPGRQE